MFVGASGKVGGREVQDKGRQCYPIYFSYGDTSCSNRETPQSQWLNTVRGSVSLRHSLLWVTQPSSLPHRRSGTQPLPTLCSTLLAGVRVFPVQLGEGNSNYRRGTPASYPSLPRKDTRHFWPYLFPWMEFGHTATPDCKRGGEDCLAVSQEERERIWQSRKPKI